MIFDKFKKKLEDNINYQNKTKKDTGIKIPFFNNKNSEYIKTIENAESFTIPDSKTITKYTNAFKNLYTDPVSANKIFNNLFTISKYINQVSSNGVVYIVKVKNSKSKFSKLLIKAAKNKTADPTSYEYYIGTCLNQLRYKNIQNFSLVYGRFVCGFNPEIPQKGIDLSKKNICDDKFPYKTHVLYEYIATESGKVETLDSYIEYLWGNDINFDLMNILLMLMISLQHAQDELNFTHYDLHLENVLVVKLNAPYKFTYKYKDKTYDIILNYYPFIIDFGRSYIDPKKVDNIIKEEIIDTDTNKKYTTFKEYQDACWENLDYILMLNNKLDKQIYDQIIKNLMEKLNKQKFREKIINRINKENGTKYTDKDLNVDLILNYYYKNNLGQITIGIKSNQFSQKFDFYRLIKSMCSSINKIDSNLSIWNILYKELESAYPFYIPFYQHLPKDYKSFTGDFERPIDIADYLYDTTSKYNVQTNSIKDKIDTELLGGSGKIVNIKKMNKGNYDKVCKKFEKMMKK